MIRPPPAARRCGTTACSEWNTPLTFVSTHSSHHSTGISSTRAGGGFWPALSTARCRPPYASTVRRTSASTALLSRTSVTTPSASPPASLIASTVVSSSCSVRDAQTTAAPAAAKRTAIARPMPRPPPVTTATCPASGRSRSAADCSIGDAAFTQGHVRRPPAPSASARVERVPEGEPVRTRHRTGARARRRSASRPAPPRRTPATTAGRERWDHRSARRPASTPRPRPKAAASIGCQSQSRP